MLSSGLLSNCLDNDGTLHTCDLAFAITLRHSHLHLIISQILRSFLPRITSFLFPSTLHIHHLSNKTILDIKHIPMSLFSRFFNFLSSFFWGRRPNDTTHTIDPDDDSWLSATLQNNLRRGYLLVDEREEVRVRVGWAPWEGDEDYDEAERPHW